MTEAGFRLSQPVRTLTGGWTVAGWAAWRRLAGSHDVNRWPDVLGAGMALHQALAAVAETAFLAERADHWSIAERLSWAGELPTQIIDFTPYWRPASFGLAVVVADAVAWHGAGRRLLDAFELAEPAESRSMIARAALFRLITAERVASGHQAPLAYLRINAEAYSGVCTVLGVC